MIYTVAPFVARSSRRGASSTIDYACARDALFWSSWLIGFDPSWSEGFAKDGYVVVDRPVSDEIALGLAAECRSFRDAGIFAPAGIGTGESYRVREEVRNNRIVWWDAETCLPFQARFQQFLEEAMTALNRGLLLALQTYEAQFSIYPPGCFYKKHVDCFKNRSNRQISMTFYLNPDWQDSDGGHIVLYPEGGEAVRIAPECNRMVLFPSGTMLHEVLPTRRERLAIAVWFKNRAWPLV